MRVLMAIAFCLVLSMAVGCATSANRYQPAQTLGAGEVKLMVAGGVSPNIAAQPVEDLQDDMQDKLDAYADEHPDARDEAAAVAGGDIVEDLFLDPFTWYVPDVEVIGAVGVHDRVDLEVRASSAPYFRFNTKVLLSTFGESGAISVAPGVGYLPISFSSSTSAFNTDYEDELKGSAWVVEAPVLLGLEYKHAAPYIRVTYIYTHTDLTFTRKVTELDPEFDESVADTFDEHYGALSLGVEIRASWFRLTPEVTGGVSQNNQWFAAPGVAIGAQF